jgi:hypothetical protein
MLNLTVAIDFLLNLPSTQTNVCNLFWMLQLLMSPKLLNFITLLLFVNLFTGSKLITEFNTVLSLLYKTFHSGHSFFLQFLLGSSLERNCSARSSSLVTLNRPSNNCRQKSQLSLYTVLLLLCEIVFLPTFVISHLTLVLLNLILIHHWLPFLLLSFSKDSKLIFSLFFSSLVSRPRLYLDGYLRNWRGFVVSYYCPFAIIHPHVTHCSFMLFGFVVSGNKLSLVCLTFTDTLNQLHSTLVFICTSLRTILYFSFFIALLLWNTLACFTIR